MIAQGKLIAQEIHTVVRLVTSGERQCTPSLQSPPTAAVGRPSSLSWSIPCELSLPLICLRR